MLTLSLRIDLHVHHHELDEPGVGGKLDQILAALANIAAKEILMSTQLDALTAQVTATTDIEKSAITLIQGLAAQIVSLKDDPAKLSALAASLNTSAADLSAAITANTPAAPPAP